MMTQPALRARKLIRRFGEGPTAATVLHELSLVIPTGELVLFMGPSGSGKSTLLAVLSGLLRPDEGQVLALGKDIWRLNEREREEFRLKHMGFIFQGYNLFPALSARQQLQIVLEWGENVAPRDARRRADEMLSILRLSRQAHLRPAQLSGGEKQRVAIGRAMVKRPALCFADEPTSALDWSHGQEAIELLREAALEHGTTVLIVSHDHRLVPYANRVFHLEDGRLVPQNSVRESRAVAARKSLFRLNPHALFGQSHEGLS